MTIAVASALGAAAPLALGRFDAGRVVAEALRELGLRPRRGQAVGPGSEQIADAVEGSCRSAQRFLNAPDSRRPVLGGERTTARLVTSRFILAFH